MPTIFTANSSSITLNGQPVDGVQAIDYRLVRQQSSVYALGSPERVTTYYGATSVEGRIVVASATPALDALAGSGEAFQVVASLIHGQTSRSVAFDECQFSRKEFTLGSGGHAETTYFFSATRVREEESGGAGAAA